MATSAAMQTPGSAAEAIDWPRAFDAADAGQPQAARQLFEALYAELKRLAQRELQRHEGLTIGPTTLLHEAWLSLAPRDGTRFADPQRFMSYAAKAMRGLTIDLLRERQAVKRGGDVDITGLDTRSAEALAAPGGIDALEDGLAALAALDPALAELVDLHFFGGLGFGEIAALRGVSERTVQRDWQKARVLLYRELSPDPPPASERAWR